MAESLYIVESHGKTESSRAEDCALPKPALDLAANLEFLIMAGFRSLRFHDVSIIASN
jgi:hypothetical protein